MSDVGPEKLAQYQAVAALNHALFTGMLLCVASRRGHKDAGDLTFQVFRRQHHDKFLSSFEKLGLTGLPDAVACAQYHYLSNGVGGVEVEFMPESDRKAWVHFCHPRWMYEGTALCGMPIEVSHGFLRGWYAHIGVSLKNNRLGFVCTSQDMDGLYGMAGYFYEYDHDLAVAERLVFAPGEMAPPFDIDTAPELDTTTWPEARLQKANRNYAMEYIRNALSEMAKAFGPADTVGLGGLAAQLIGKQFYRESEHILGRERSSSAEGFASWLAAMASGYDERVEVEKAGDAMLVRQFGWRAMRGAGALPPAVFEAWNGLYQGALSVHNRFLALEVTRRLDFGDDCFEWRIRPRGPAAF
jgi:hypothetical protein